MVVYLTGKRAWEEARCSVPDAPPEILDKVIIWRMSDPRYSYKEGKERDIKMQRQWTIEVRADFNDAEKNDAITECVRQHAVAINATVVLIKDNGQVPQTVCYSDDFFTGHDDIALLENKLGKALETQAEETGLTVSDEMMQTMRDMQHDKNDAKR